MELYQNHHLNFAGLLSIDVQKLSIKLDAIQQILMIKSSFPKWKTRVTSVNMDEILFSAIPPLLWYPTCFPPSFCCVSLFMGVICRMSLQEWYIAVQDHKMGNMFVTKCNRTFTWIWIWVRYQTLLPLKIKQNGTDLKVCI